MKRERTLTKSRFKLGLECPKKLFYTGKERYVNNKLDDPFLAALADGGYQVGELAKHYFPNGHDITTLDYAEAELQTNTLLKRDKVVIYEPAIRYNNLFIRIDILVKDGSHFDLIEVKAKSFDTSKEQPFWAKKGAKKLNSAWEPYLHDVAFQHHVLKKAFPNSTINSYLMLADKNKVCTVDGLNQKFRIIKDNTSKGVAISDELSEADLVDKMLCQINVDKEVKHIQTKAWFDNRSFDDHIYFLAEAYKNDTPIAGEIGKKCKSCEFNCSEAQEKNGFKSGFKECWQAKFGWSDKDFLEPNILDIWNFRDTDKLLAKNKIKLADLKPEDIGVDGNTLNSKNTKNRQWLQVVMARNGDNEAYFDRQGFKEEMSRWKYPLHFIDFETTTVALPFTKGRKPYEGIAFQFSHHIYYEDGTIKHADEYLNVEQGVFPSFDFVRALKQALTKDEGTIFRYAEHENTYLNLIYRQLQSTIPQPKDINELLAFIELITHSGSASDKAWKGERDMVDMLKLVTRYYYHPSMGGSNSIKQVLPAILNSSLFIKNKYKDPIYGAKGGISSHNFTNWQWAVMDNNKLKDPYTLLPDMFNDMPDKDIELLSEGNSLNNGGAALMAYAKLQFQEMSTYERDEIKKALLKYCELDTFAMVMIFEAWKDWCG